MVNLKHRHVPVNRLDTSLHTKETLLPVLCTTFGSQVTSVLSIFQPHNTLIRYKRYIHLTRKDRLISEADVNILLRRLLGNISHSNSTS